MTHVEGTLGDRARAALGDPFLRRAVRFTVERLREGKRRSSAALGDWEARREAGRALRAHVIENLDHYLDEFCRNVEALGQKTYLAADPEEAARLVLGILKEREARRVVKSKSMVSEEVAINHRLAGHGIECLETDLGEWIVQLAGEAPSHIILPAIHKSRADVRELFEREGGEPLAAETRVLAGHARKRLRERFAAADVGMTGCNFAIADTGSVVLFTNEGNGRMVTTLPRVHVVMMGLERLLPSLGDLALMADLLPRSATGQKLTTYVSVLTGARRYGEADGAAEMHVVILDNGRSRQLGDARFQEILHCIRCGACLNVCPVYRQIGGHAYGSVYPGPIGAVLTPLLRENDAQAAELAQASTLCGACHEACPVKIPLEDMLVSLRRRDVLRRPPLDRERIAMRVFATIVARPALYRFLMRLARRVLGWLGPRGARWLERLPGLAAWHSHRALPVLAPSSFTDEWRKRRE